jgi:hypothetical protein
MILKFFGIGRWGTRTHTHTQIKLLFFGIFWGFQNAFHDGMIGMGYYERDGWMDGHVAFILFWFACGKSPIILCG